jgi:hypothetical protein
MFLLSRRSGGYSQEVSMPPEASEATVSEVLTHLLKRHQFLLEFLKIESFLYDSFC